MHVSQSKSEQIDPALGTAVDRGAEVLVPKVLWLYQL